MADAFLTGVITNKGRETLAKSFAQANGSASSFAFKFKYGEGGFIQTASGRIPKDPADGLSLTDVEAPSLGLFTYEKSFVVADVSFIAPSSINLRCRLVEGEANDSGAGENPRFFEVGIFDQNNNLIAYATVPEQTKTGNKILTNYVQIVF